VLVTVGFGRPYQGDDPQSCIDGPLRQKGRSSPTRGSADSVSVSRSIPMTPVQRAQPARRALDARMMCTMLVRQSIDATPHRPSFREEPS